MPASRPPGPRPLSEAKGAAPVARVALVGDRSADVAAHGRVPDLLDGLRRRDGLRVDAYWLPTDEIATDEIATDETATDETATDETATDADPTGEIALGQAAPGGVATAALDGFDGIWLVPGGPYASERGALTAIRVARERGIPFLGTCGGLQYAVLEFARTVCALADAAHAEVDPLAPDPLIVPIACALSGHEGVVLITRDSLAERVIGADRTVERYFCSYGINPGHLGPLLAHGLRFSGVDEAGEARILELPHHPFFLATLFQPELGPDTSRPHPIIRGFAEAAVARAAARATARRPG
ncbi:glutamine amidotransferase-related protein [Frankia sp. AgKG'84/4]